MLNDVDKILELLEKTQLSVSEKKELDALLSDIPDSEKLVKTFNSLKNTLNKNSHIDEVILGEYVLYKNNMLSNAGTMVLLERTFQDHLRTCEHCSEIIKEFNAEYAEVDSFLSSSITQTEKEYQPDTITNNLFQKFSTVKYAITAISAVIILYIGLIAGSSVLVPDYKQNAISEDERGFYNTRGRTSEDFQRGLDAVEKKQFDNAINYFEEDIKLNRSQSSIFYSHFILGVTYIQSSESSFLGTFKSFDKERVEKGIENLKKAIELNNSGRYNNLNYDAHYFIGKAYLLIDEYNSAKENFMVVVNNKGSYYKKATELLDQIDKR